MIHPHFIIDTKYDISSLTLSHMHGLAITELLVPQIRLHFILLVFTSVASNGDRMVCAESLRPMRFRRALLLPKPASIFLCFWILPVLLTTSPLPVTGSTRCLSFKAFSSKTFTIILKGLHFYSVCLSKPVNT